MASRPVREFPLEIVCVGKNGRRERRLTSLPVVIRDAFGNFVFDNRSNEPLFLAQLARGRYTVTTKCDAWSFMRPVRIDKQRQRVVLE